MASTVGMWGYSIAAVVTVFELTGSAQYVGLVSILQFAAPLFLAPLGGALADRFDRRALMVFAQTGCAVAAGSLFLVVVQVGLRHVWIVLIIFFVLGLASALSDPARHALVQALVPRADFAQAIALNSLTFNVGRAVGPASAGLLLVWGGPAAVFALTATAYLLFVLALLVIRATPAPERQRSQQGLAAGLTHVLADRGKLALLAGVGAAGFATDPVVTLAPLLAEDLTSPARGWLSIDRAELAVGALASSFGMGAVLAIFMLRRLHDWRGYRRIGLGGLALVAAMIAMLAAAPNLEISCGVLLVAGAGYFLALTSLTTLLQVTIPEHLRGRVMALWGMSFLGSRPLAAIVDSTVAELLSPRTALVVVVVLVSIVGTWVARATVELDKVM